MKWLSLLSSLTMSLFCFLLIAAGISSTNGWTFSSPPPRQNSANQIGPTTVAAPARGQQAMPALSALIDVARQLSESEEFSDEEEDTSGDVYGPGGFMFLILCFCVYCSCRERVNQCIGCPEDSCCGMYGGGDSEWINSACSICIGVGEEAKAEVESRVRV